MASIVLELQRDALDRGVPVPDLLRKALVVARKLGLAEFEAWIGYELNGYPLDEARIPAYRHLRGQPKAFNPIRGWQPILFESDKDAEHISRRACMQRIAEIQNFLDNQQEGSAFAMPFNPEAEAAIRRAIHFDTQIMTFFPMAALAGVLDAVRTTVLNWTLELEQRGVLGHGLSFSEQDKKAAAQASQITNLFLGPVQSAQVQQGSPQAVQVHFGVDIDLGQVRDLLARLKESLAALGLADAARATVAADVETIEAQVKSPSPKPSIIRAALRSVGAVLQEAATSAAAQVLAAEIGRLLGR